MDRGFEGLKLAAYADPGSKRAIELLKPPGLRVKGWATLPGNPWSIGYGSTRGVTEGMVITEAQADVRHLEELAQVEEVLLRLISRAATNNQVSALVLFCRNIGFGRAASGKDPGKDGFHVLKTGDPSTMLKCLLAGETELAADEFPKWCGHNPATMKGLLERRLAEMDLFLKPDAPANLGGEP